MEKNNQTKKTFYKNLYKKWWFWFIILILITKLPIFTKTDSTSTPVVNNSKTQEQKVDEMKEENKSELDKMGFSARNVRNDTTGNFRISTIAEPIEIEKYALEYYNEFFKDDKEIHFIVNFNNNTTTRIASIGNLLDVSILEYEKKEEHDARDLGGGMLLAEYHINKSDGEIKEIQ